MTDDHEINILQLPQNNHRLFIHMKEKSKILNRTLLFLHYRFLFINVFLPGEYDSLLCCIPGKAPFPAKASSR